MIAEAQPPAILAQMLVRADGSIVGTIGGGMVERKVIEESLQALQERKPRLFHGRMARNGADAVGQIVEVHVSIYQRPWYASTSGVDWCGACQPGDSPECGGIRI
ncbi:XdhC family protein [Escherichia coli]